MKRILIPVVVFLLLSAGCKKEQSIEKDNTSRSNEIAAVEVGPDYNYNPYDNTGNMHNAGLAFVLSNPNIDNMTDNDLINLSNTWGYNTYHVYEQNLSQRVFAFLDDQSNNYKNEIQSTTYSEKVKVDLINLIDLINDDSYPDPTAVSYSEYKDKITDFEDNVLSDQGLSVSEKELILGSASIARYSMYYGWQHSEPMPPSTMAMSKVTKLAIAACADAANFAHSWSVTEAVATSVIVYNHLP